MKPPNLRALLRDHLGSLDAYVGRVEGDAARRHFACLPLLARADLREHFAMSGRTRRSPQERFNALLSFLYSMLMNDCRSALESVGLAPEDFEMRTGGAVSLRDDARKAVVTAYQERKQETLRHPLLEQDASIGLLPLLEGRFLARTVRGEMDSYVPYLMR